MSAQSRVETLLDLLEEGVGRSADATAFRFLTEGALMPGADAAEVEVSHRLLYHEARAVAAGLQAVASRADRALLLYPSGIDVLPSVFGCIAAGVVAVPAVPPFGRIERALPRLLSIVADAQATVGLTTSSLLPLLESVWPSEGMLQDFKWIATDLVEPDTGNDWKRPDLASEDMAILQYTSGSTSSPKGVMLRHSNILSEVAQFRSAMDERIQGATVCWMPLFHDGGLMGGVFVPLYFRMESVLIAPEAFLGRPYRWLQAISRFEAPMNGGPNFGYEMCVRKVTAEQKATLDLSCWKVAVNSAEPVALRTLNRFAEAFGPCGFDMSAFAPAYGLAEATLFVSVRRPDWDEPRQPTVRYLDGPALSEHRIVDSGAEAPGAVAVVGCGASLPLQDVVIVDPATGLRCGSREVGEIWVTGPTVGAGYWRLEERSTEAFDARIEGDDRRFLRTGDLGFLDAGELFPTGRLKDMVIIRGRNLYPHDIELVVEESHPVLRPGCGAAFPIPVDEQEEIAIMHEVADGSFESAEVFDSIRKAVNQQLGVQPAAILLVERGAIAKTSSGKIQRHACRQAYLDGTEHVAAWRAPAGARGR